MIAENEKSPMKQWIFRTLTTMAIATTLGTLATQVCCSLAQPIAPNANASNNATNTATASPATSVTIQPTAPTGPEPPKPGNPDSGWIR